VKKLLEFASILMSYGDLLPSLIANQMAMVTLGRMYQSPFPWWYNPNATNAYHGGVEAMSSKVILIMPKNQESSKFQRFKIQELGFKNQDSRFKNQVSRIKIQE